MGRVRNNPRSASPQKDAPYSQLSMYKTYFKSQKNIHGSSHRDMAKTRIEKALQDEEQYQYQMALLELKQNEKNGKFEF